MSEKLDKESFQQFRWDWLNAMKDNSGSGADIADKIQKTFWARIESDREAIRAETRAEVLKSAFELGERVEIEKSPGEWLNGIIMATASGAHFSTGGYNVRRPPKMRPMTREEKVEALRGMSKDPMWRIEAGPLDRSKLKDETLDDLCHVAGIPTEVEES